MVLHETIKINLLNVDPCLMGQHYHVILLIFKFHKINELKNRATFS